MGRSVSAAECLEAAIPVLSTVSVGIISDVDGTISYITSEPDAARVSSDAQEILAELSHHLTLVSLLSGRSVAQLRRMVPVQGLTLVGNHGLEEVVHGEERIHPEAVPFLDLLSESADYLGSCLPHEGIVIENKGPTVAVHYRLARDRAQARDSVLEALDECPATKGLVLREGRRVVDILPPVLMDKGRAVRHLVQASGIVGVIFMGDDLTDLDAFNELAVLRSTGRYQCLLVAVGSEEARPEVIDAADCVLDGVDEAISFLGLVLDWRRASGV